MPDPAGCHSRSLGCAAGQCAWQAACSERRWCGCSIPTPSGIQRRWTAMPDPGGSDLEDLIDAVDPVVDAALAEAFDSVVAYRSAIAEVRSAAGAYYGGPDLVMDDAAYDALMARVAATEAAHPQWKLAESPTEAIAAGAGVVGDVEHSTPMLSLDNVFDEDTLRRWAARLQRLLGRPAGGYTVEPKIDGLAVAARYVDGQLTQVATRGDGRAGEDVTGPARRPGRYARRTGATTRRCRFSPTPCTDSAAATGNRSRTAPRWPACKGSASRPPPGRRPGCRCARRSTR